MKVEFLKHGYFKGNIYKKGDICEMTKQSAKGYIEFRSVKEYFGKKKHGENINTDESNNKSLDEYTVKELQELCKNNNLSYQGKKEDMIKLLKEKKIS